MKSQTISRATVFEKILFSGAITLVRLIQARSTLGSGCLFHIGDEKLGPGECEIGMLIPRGAVDNKLPEFATELKDISFILNTFSEVATGKQDDLLIKTISSTDLAVYLHAPVMFATCLAVGVERVVGLYKQILEIKKLRGELLKQGVPEKETDNIGDYANKRMEKGIKEVSIEIVAQFYTKNDDGRKHELEVAVGISLSKLANRIDCGYNFEVRAEPPKKTEANTDAEQKTAANIQLIQGAIKNMQFMKLEGPKILGLGEGKEKIEPKKGKH
ncbi:MAG TPA: hypothetical protein VN048_06630 [Verrucomicrobiae bacterium]|nr:hypothetical protein [Verrucomicrobiae bacterium]